MTSKNTKKIYSEPILQIIDFANDVLTADGSTDIGGEYPWD